FDVVRLRREQLLQRVSGSIRFEGPNFHFSEALAAELRFAAERLLSDERIRSDRARVNLVVDQMRELEHVDVADADALLELFAGHTVEERRLAVVGKRRRFELGFDLRLDGAVEDRG